MYKKVDNKCSLCTYKYVSYLYLHRCNKDAKINDGFI